MVYISDERETVAQLKEIEGYEGSLDDYFQKFNGLNGGIYENSSATLLAYYPHFLVCGEPMDQEGAKLAIEEIKKFPEGVREIMRLLQDQEIDFITQLCMSEVMWEAQEYVKSTRKWLDQPLITTPWSFMNTSVQNVSSVGVLEATAGISSTIFENSFPFKPVNAIAHHMAEIDKYAREIETLKLMQTARSTKIHADISALTKKLKVHKAEIKRLLPKKLDSMMQKYLSSRYTPGELRKLRTATYAQKLARKGAKSSNAAIQARTATSELQFLSKSGLEKLQKSLKYIKSLGKYAKGAGLIASVGVVTYDTTAAYMETGSKKEAFKAFSSGVAGLGAGAAAGGLTSAGVAMGIGALAGEVGLAGGLLLCSPIIGWVVVIGAGVVVGGYVANKTTDLVNYLWEPENRQKEWERIKSWGASVEKYITDAWESQRNWILSFYGT